MIGAWISSASAAPGKLFWILELGDGDRTIGVIGAIEAIGDGGGWTTGIYDTGGGRITGTYWLSYSWYGISAYCGGGGAACNCIK